jgi:hypothetical protein
MPLVDMVHIKLILDVWVEVQMNFRPLRSLAPDIAISMGL